MSGRCSSNLSRENSGWCNSVYCEKVHNNALWAGMECAYCGRTTGPWSKIKDFCSANPGADCFAVTEKVKREDNSIWTREKCLYCGTYLTYWDCMFALA